MHLVKSDSLIERGLRAAEFNIFEQNRIWARYSNEKSDVAASLMRTIRALHARMTDDRELSALSIGAGNEPQFRVLQAAFQRGLWLYDIDGAALATIQERQVRQQLNSIHLVQGDYRRDFRNSAVTRQSVETILDGQKQDLVTLHHCLYYSKACEWHALLRAVFEEVLQPAGAIHVVMMSAREKAPFTTSWLYNHFAGKFFGSSTDQDLLGLRSELVSEKGLGDCEFTSETRKVEFWVDDFDLFMSVVWMILLYPQEHDYTLDQRIEITEFIIEHFWGPKRPLVQSQDYVTLHKAGSIRTRSNLSKPSERFGCA